MKIRMLVPLVALAAFAAACSGASSNGGPVKDDSPVTAKSATGMWKLHYDWSGSAPKAWTDVFGSDVGDLDVAIPSEAQKRGMFTAKTDWGFAPITSIVDSGTVAWTVTFNGGAITLDFNGKGTGSSLTGTAKFSNDESTATWKATKVTTTFVPAEKLAGDWTMTFQWTRRTPGELLVTCDGQGSCTIPKGQAGGPSTDDVGTAELDGNVFSLAFPDAKHVGVAVSDGTFWGYMDSTGGNTGIWTATRGKPSSGGGSSSGCTADVDCGHCERCERTTGRCVSRLSC